MPPHATPLLTRLRRHRGLWVLAVFVLLVKFASGTVCLADGPGTSRATDSTAIAHLDTSSDLAIDAPSASDDGTCWLGEGSRCHCACAHSMTLPSSAATPALAQEPQLPVPALSSGWVPAVTGSLLRPPIA
ncbi:hypothetical protein ACFWZ3_05300 [Frateuria sp. GZRR35]|jgi:hypothetical protein|uniref:hypothetical protein n=1 Tax=Frateuria sp. GZRR35 TaxID=3351536 RepID=UPI003EDC2F16